MSVEEEKSDLLKSCEMDHNILYKESNFDALFSLKIVN